MGMDKDQVWTTDKTWIGVKSINITLGIEFSRMSTEDGPNKKMWGKKGNKTRRRKEDLKLIDK